MTVDVRGKRAEQLFDVQVATLVGKDAEETRAAHTDGDSAKVQLLVARKTGNFERGNER
ncbi:MAG: ABC transporter ATP-binding protein [Myxococcota bacterium]|nr:ABC transporter ATP-binding protein [Deltaproteobacteria bacterium]MDQ3335387.1 ABC transporter ATP-binding protein [Myxococcota bacterium]